MRIKLTPEQSNALIKEHHRLMAIMAKRMNYTARKEQRER